MTRRPAALTILCLIVLAAGAQAAHATFRGRPGLVAAGLSDGLHVANPDGSGARVVGDFVNANTPAWSHDGRRVVVAADTPDSNLDDQNYDIYVVDLATGESRQLTHGTGDDYWPSWGANDRSIVFQRVRTPASDPSAFTKQLFRIRLNGGHARALPVESPYLGGAEVAPRGRTIAFVDDGDVFLTGRHGRGTHRIVSFPDGDEQSVAGSVSWSPSGKQLAITASLNSPCDDCADVWAVNRSGSNLHKVTTAPGSYGQAFFRPRGNKVAFCEVTWNAVDTEPISEALRLANLNGSNQKTLGSFCGSAWQALPAS
jgi:Tol biopolymer transport system component